MRLAVINLSRKGTVWNIFTETNKEEKIFVISGHHLLCVATLVQYWSFVGENFNTVLSVRIIFLVKNYIRCPTEKTFPPRFAIVHPAVHSATKYFLISSHTNLMIINSIPGRKKILFLKKYIGKNWYYRLILNNCIRIEFWAFLWTRCLCE